MNSPWSLTPVSAVGLAGLHHAGRWLVGPCEMERREGLAGSAWRGNKDLAQGQEE
jgi:hypothetical protein